MDRKTCSKCGHKIPDGIAYIPEIGEVCMTCYTNYAKELENTKIVTSNSTKG